MNRRADGAIVDPTAATSSKRAAVRLFGAVEALLESIGMARRMDPSDQKEFDHYVAAVRAQIDEAAFAKAWAEGRVMILRQDSGQALEQVIQYALEKTRASV